MASNQLRTKPYLPGLSQPEFLDQQLRASDITGRDSQLFAVWRVTAIVDKILRGDVLLSIVRLKRYLLRGPHALISFSLML